MPRCVSSAISISENNTTSAELIAFFVLITSSLHSNLYKVSEDSGTLPLFSSLLYFLNRFRDGSA